MSDDYEKCRTCGHAVMLMVQKGTGYCRPSCEVPDPFVSGGDG